MAVKVMTAPQGPIDYSATLDPPQRAKLASRDDFRGFPKGFALSALAVNDKTGEMGLIDSVRKMSRGIFFAIVQTHFLTKMSKCHDPICQS